MKAPLLPTVDSQRQRLAPTNGAPTVKLACTVEASNTTAAPADCAAVRGVFKLDPVCAELVTVSRLPNP